MKNTKKGFTLVELLIVIGILAILTAAVVIILNPAELLRQARDSQRFSDLDAVKNAISLYMVDVANPTLSTTTSNCYMYSNGSSTGCAVFATATTASINATRVTDGTGWIPVDFDDISGGSPLTILPIDPVNDATYYYAFASDDTNKTFEMDANLESQKYAESGGSDKESTDGGSRDDTYEIGNDPGLNL